MEGFYSQFWSQLLAGTILLLLGVIIVPPTIKKIINQKHTGGGDNVAGNKYIVVGQTEQSSQTKSSENSTPGQFSPSTEDIKTVLKDRIGIVRIPNFFGTRVHIGAVVSNNEQSPVIIKKFWISINNHILRFKQFFTFQANQLRIPDVTTQMPLLIQSNNGKELFIELENVDGFFINDGRNFGALFVQLENNKVIETKFEFKFDKTSSDRTDLNNLPSGVGALVIELPLT